MATKVIHVGPELAPLGLTRAVISIEVKNTATVKQPQPKASLRTLPAV